MLLNWLYQYYTMETTRLTSPGGLNTSFPSLKANLTLSAGVALTGIALPIALSYTLQPLLNASPVQAFAAGAALCSTSFGNTFTMVSASGLGLSRLGVVLTSDAAMDDVVGLIMVQVISNLGGDSFSAVTIVRPIFVSLAFAVSAPAVCLFVVKPVTTWLNRYREGSQPSSLNTVLGKTQTALAVHTALLIALITGATYTRTSNLFAAYIAGAWVSWWDFKVPHAMPTDDKLSGQAIYARYYHQVVSKILQPFSLAPVGFSIPITRMFCAAIVWRGIVYSALMAAGKMVCGLWLVRLPLGKERSLTHPLILELAMCARGEIGFLILGVESPKGSSRL
jgi:Kef-type K+ transport system membrane component KefB